jgi:hypothetical protein
MLAQRREVVVAEVTLRCDLDATSALEGMRISGRTRS